MNDAQRWRHLPPGRQRPVIEQLEEDARMFEENGDEEGAAYAGDLRRAAAALRFVAGLGGCNPEGRT